MNYFLHTRKLPFAFLLFSLPFFVYSQNSFFKTYGKTGKNESARSFVEATNGGFMMLGQAHDSIRYDSDLFLIRTDANGQEIWSKSIDVEGQDIPKKIIKRADGTYLLFSNFTKKGESFNDIAATAVDTSGNVIWQKLIYDQYTNDVHDAYLMPDSGTVLLGIRGKTDSTDTNISAWKLDKHGQLLWQYDYPRNEMVVDFGFTQLANGNFVCISEQFYSRWFYIIDGTGSEVFSTTLQGGAFPSRGLSNINLIEGTNGGIYLMYGAGGAMGMIKLDTSGVVQASHSIVPVDPRIGSNVDEVKNVIVNSQGDFVLLVESPHLYWGIMEVDVNGFQLGEAFFGYFHDHNEWIYDAIDTGNGYRILGESSSQGNFDAVLHFLNTSGTKLKEERYGLSGGREDERCLDFTLSPGGDYVLVGFDIDVWPNTPLLVRHLSDYGNPIWESRISNNYQYRGLARVTRSHTDGFKILVYPEKPGQMEINTIDAQGNLLSTRNYWGPFFFNDFQPTLDGNYVIASADISNAPHRGALTKTNEMDQIIWDQSYAAPFSGAVNSRFNSVVVCKDSGFVAAGTVRLGNKYELLLVKYDKNGSILWEKTYKEGARFLEAHTCHETVDGNLVAFATCQKPSLQNSLILVTDSAGNRIFSKVYGDSATFMGYTYGTVDLEGKGFAFAATSDTLLRYNKLHSEFHLRVTRLDSAGNVKWTYKGLQGLYPNFKKIVATPDNGFAVAGFCRFAGSEQYFILKLNKDGKVTAMDLPQASSLSLNVFPNPGQEICNVAFENNQTGTCQLSMIDLQGKVIYSRQMGKQAKKLQHQIPTEGLSKGVYIVTLRIAGETMSKTWMKR